MQTIFGRLNLLFLKTWNVSLYMVMVKTRKKIRVNFEKGNYNESERSENKVLGVPKFQIQLQIVFGISMAKCWFSNEVIKESRKSEKSNGQTGPYI